MGMRPDGIFTKEEWNRLHQYSLDLGTTVRNIELAQKDPDFNLARHRADRCAWWNATKGMLVTVDGLHPEDRLR